MKILLLFLWLGIACLSRTAAGATYGNATFWRSEGRDGLNEAIRNSGIRYNGKAKNVILFIGDGMDIATQTLAGHMKTTPYGTHAKQRKLVWEKFPHMGLSRTYSENFIIPDSAATASAMTTGVKAQNGVSGYDGSVAQGSCNDAAKAQPLESIFKTAKNDGRAVAVVTTDAINGGTPQNTYVNTCNRGWSYPDRISTTCKGKVVDTVQQLLDKALDYEVFLGGGSNYFLPKPEGVRKDNKNIPNTWKQRQANKNRRYRYITSKSELPNAENTDYLLGIFAEEKMNPHSKADQPSLREMTETAFKIVRRNKKGFFMMVEGANVDLYNHYSRTQKAANEVIGLEEAVQFIKDNTNPEETLIIVTSDHGHTTSFGNNMLREQNPFDLVKNAAGQMQTASDGEFYPAISYGIGPNTIRNSTTLSPNKVAKADYQYSSLIPRGGGYHGGAYVPIYANGVNAHFLTSTHEQPYIYYVMEYAACLGYYGNRQEC